MAPEESRSQRARTAVERALVRVVHHYGTRPEFVLIGGLVPELLCAASPYGHAGTIDIDVQVDLEIAAGSINAVRLERALRKAGFEPDAKRVWRWQDRSSSPPAVIRFELLADLPDQPAGVTATFAQSGELGAANLRGTGYATRDIEVQRLSAVIAGEYLHAEVNVTGLAGFLLAKIEAAYSRRRPKDWYDIAFVLVHNDLGGPEAAASAVLAKFSDDLKALQPAIADLGANFADGDAQGSDAYVSQIVFDHPDLDPVRVRADAMLAVEAFIASLREGDPS